MHRDVTLVARKISEFHNFRGEWHFKNFDSHGYLRDYNANTFL